MYEDTEIEVPGTLIVEDTCGTCFVPVIDDGHGEYIHAPQEKTHPAYQKYGCRYGQKGLVDYPVAGL